MSKYILFIFHIEMDYRVEGVENWRSLDGHLSMLVCREHIQAIQEQQT
jgi:hypothetical protein